MKNKINYFKKSELVLFFFSLLLIIVSFLIWDRNSYLNLIASIIGVSSLIFIAKGNPFGQILISLFAIIYGVISYKFSYYGEMITYLGMSLPMAIFSFVSWIKNPSEGKKAEVKINSLKIKEYFFMIFLTIIITICFYFILKSLNTSNIIPSTISVSTSFLAVYLTFRRSEYYALLYALNDIILIVLWVLASTKNRAYLSVVTCFVVFFLNDLYGFINWSKMKKRQGIRKKD